MHCLGNRGERALAGGFDHELVAGIEQPLHEGEEFAGLQHRFAAGELDQLAGLQGFYLGDNLFVGEWLPAGKGVLGVAPGAAQIAACEPDEDAGNTGEGALALYGLVELDEAQRTSGVRLRGDVQIGCGLGKQFKHGGVRSYS